MPYPGPGSEFTSGPREETVGKFAPPTTVPTTGIPMKITSHMAKMYPNISVPYQALYL